ncbi:MAG: RNA polymerase factor sigma-54 [Candidatus Brocadiae bacterium]|nr:RNA polymerase factor sigma-54 [Candidatus Brocadiia bacterium]
MRMEAHLSHRQELRMKLAPQIIQSIEILQLPLLELIETVKAEMLDNVTLEEDQEQEEHAEAKGIEQTAGTGTPDDPDAPDDRTREALDTLERQREDDWALRIRSSGGDGTDKKMEALMNTPARGTTLRGHLMEQWEELDLPEKIRRIGAFLIDNLNDNGQVAHPFESLTDAEGTIREEGLLDAFNRSVRAEAEEFMDSIRALDPDQYAGKTVRRQVLLGLHDHDLDREFKLAILNGMDDHLVLKAPLDTVLEPVLATQKDIYVALGRIQQLEPRGVGARNTQECLLLQLDREDDEYEFKKLLIEKHLEDIGQNKLPKIVKETQRDVEDVKEVVEQIRHMNAHPGSSFVSDSVPYVLPDVIVEEREGEYIVKLEDGFIPRLCISAHYRDRLADPAAKPEEKEFIRGKIEKAKRLISSIEQRQATLFRISTELVRVQREFLDQGVNHLKPLRMQEIADTLGLHVSTVSRAISDKYAQTPRGIFPLKFFFSGATEASDGEDKSRVSVQSRIREMVEGENHANPLSDGDIVDKLKAEGLNIARRTVTKYRKALKIASSRQRKQF